MKKYWDRFYDSRLGKYIVFSFLYYFMLQVFGFDITLIVGIGNIIGEMHYINKK